MSRIQDVRSERIRQVRDELCRTVDQWVPALFPNARVADGGRQWRVGSVAGEPGESLGIVRHGRKSGQWLDFADSAGEPERGKDPVDLLKAVYGMPAFEAAEWANTRLLGGSIEAPAVVRSREERAAERQREQGQRRDEAIRRAREHWQRCQRGDPAGLIASYLRARGIVDSLGRTPAIPPTIRYNPRCAHYAERADGERVRDHTGPALVAAVSQPEPGGRSRVTAVQRTWLRPDGSGKADVDPDKMSMGHQGVGAVRLGPLTDVLYLTEGIEDALAIELLTGKTVWACLGTAGIKNARVPNTVRRVVFCADNDDKGASVNACKSRAVDLYRLGYDVRVEIPSRGLDWAAEIARAAP